MRRLDLRLEDRRLQSRDHLTLLHDRVEVGVHLVHDSRHLSADLDGDDGLQRTGRANLIDHVPAGQLQRRHLRFTAAPTDVVGTRTGADGDQDEND